MGYYYYYYYYYYHYYYYYYTAGNAPFVNCSKAMYRMRGWSSLVVTQPITRHHLLCVQCVCVRVCTALSGICYSGPSNWVQVNFLPGITADITGHSIPATQTILSPSVPETVSIRDRKLRNTTESGT